jgi:hypothetical protein
MRVDFRSAWCPFYPGRPGYEVRHDAEFMLTDGNKVTVPAGFWYNGASIPSAFWQVTFTPFDPRIIDAACIHDFLYTARTSPREVADQTLVVYLRQSPDVHVRSWLVGAAVRAFGWAAWAESKTDAQYRSHLIQQIKNSGRDPHAYGLLQSH